MDELPDYNRRQLETGIRSDGSDIAPAYSFVTVQIKGTKTGLAGVSDRVTLFDEGDHYRDMYAELKGAVIEFGSRDWKSDDLQYKYGVEIYGLTVPYRREFIAEYLLIEFIKEIKTKVYGL